MALDGVDAQVQPFTDGRVGQALAGEREDLLFAQGQLVDDLMCVAELPVATEQRFHQLPR